MIKDLILKHLLKKDKANGLIFTPAQPALFFNIWRRGWDSNPRNPFGLNGFRDRPIQPLSHLSKCELLILIVGTRVIK
jgi:hypothetical protein